MLNDEMDPIGQKIVKTPLFFPNRMVEFIRIYLSTEGSKCEKKLCKKKIYL